MKRTIEFEITIGSKWADGIKLPVGGSPSNITVTFETDGADPYNDAVSALREQLDRNDFHIWYWSWID